jgi:haloacetate dehalogenase
LIAANARYFLEHTLASWTAGKSLAAFDPRALSHYRQAFDDPARIHTTCECYRAGALIDRVQDEADVNAGRKIDIPVLAMWGTAGIPASGVSPLDVWGHYARHVEGAAIDAGHFVPEENPEDCVAALLAFLA